MIERPHNDRTCLGAITDEVATMVEHGDAELLAVVEHHGTTDALISWIRSLPQRDDEGQTCDGPKVEECRPPQRLRIPAPDPNCVERAALYLGAAELIAPTPVRRLATVHTPNGLHTFPTENGEPVILDPLQSRNALQAGLFRSRRATNRNARIGVTPAEAIDWAAELAAEPADRIHQGAARVANGHRALRAVVEGIGVCAADLRDLAFLLALAAREARLYGREGVLVVKTIARAVDELDAATKRNAFGLRVGRHEVRADTKVLGSLGRVGGRIGAQIGLEALRYKLAAIGLAPPVLQAIDRELREEGLSLGPIAEPSPVVGSLGALTPQALAGRWLARKL